MKKSKILRCILLPIIGLATVAGFSAAVMLLWNWLMPAIFGITIISFWQALGILVLTRILFGGMGKHGHWMGKRGFHGNAIREKWAAMTPEERKEFMKKHRCGHGHFSYETFNECCDIKEEPKKENG